MISIGVVAAKPAQAATVTADKRTHYYLSGTLTLAGSLFFREVGVDPFPSILYSSLLVMAAGLAKEMHDNTFSSPDLIADGAGVITGGIAAAIVFQF